MDVFRSAGGAARCEPPGRIGVRAMRSHGRRPRAPVARAMLAATLACLSAAAVACPLCLGALQQTKAQQLVAAQQVVLAVPTADTGRFRVVEVVKGERPAGATIEGGYPRSAVPDPAASTSRKPRLLVRDEPFPTWTILGTIDGRHARWLQRLADAKPATERSAQAWRERVALVVPYLEHREPLAAELAYAELAAAPYATLRAAKPHFVASAVRGWLAEPSLAARQRLYLLLLGIAGNAQDAAVLERRLEDAWAGANATNLGSLLAADMELRGPARVAWVEERYLRDRTRTAPEVDAALLALSVHGNADAAIPRSRVIEAYRVFMKAHPEVAGYVAQDLAAWRYWDAVPEYVALMKSDVRQQVPSRVAILAYLRQSPSAEARQFESIEAGPGTRQ